MYMQICVRAHDMGVKGIGPIIQGLTKAGADGAQLVCYKSFEDIEKAPAGITEKQAEEIGRAFREAGLSLSVIGASFNPVHSDEAVVESGIGVFCDYIRMGSCLGCRIVGTETGSYNDEPWIYHPRNRTGEALDRVVALFGTLCDYAAQYDAAVAIEGASAHICYDTGTLMKAIQRIGRKNLKIVFDLYNFLDGGNYSDYLNILAKGLTAFDGRIHCFHIKDCVFTEDGPKQCTVGKGDLDFDCILPMIKIFDENAVLILEGTGKDDIKESIAFLRGKWQAA